MAGSYSGYGPRKERVQELISPVFDVPELQSMRVPAIVIDLSELEGGVWIVYQVVC